MENLKYYLHQLLEKRDLEETEAGKAFAFLSEEAEPAVIAAFLTALRAKGETLSELVGAAKAILRQARPFPKPEGMLLDIVGTGGDGKSTYNVSTLAALTTAAMGIPVAKHGNRAASSRCGSADLLEKLNIPISLEEPEALEQLKTCRFTFLFAPQYHSSFKKVGEVRKILGIRTLFNLLGPLTNPANPSFQLIGVFDPSWLEKIAAALLQLGCRHAWVVHGGGGSDELDLQGENLIYSVQEGKLDSFVISPEEAGLPNLDLSLIRGGLPEENLAKSRLLLQGEAGPLQDVVALNAGAAFYLCGKCKNIQEGVMLAKEVLKKGDVWKLVEKLSGKESHAKI